MSKLSLIKSLLCGRQEDMGFYICELNPYQHHLLSPVIPSVQRRKVKLKDRKEIPTRLQRKSS